MTSRIDKLLVDLLFEGRITHSEMLAIGQAVEDYQGTNGVMPPLDKALQELKKSIESIAIDPRGV